jgi:hypothetical protein
VTHHRRRHHRRHSQQALAQPASLPHPNQTHNTQTRAHTRTPTHAHLSYAAARQLPACQCQTYSYEPPWQWPGGRRGPAAAAGAVDLLPRCAPPPPARPCGRPDRARADLACTSFWPTVAPELWPPCWDPGGTCLPPTPGLTMGPGRLGWSQALVVAL